MSASLSPFGRELRHWRTHRGMSQLELAIEADSTSRHISFLETGRSRPSAAMVDRLCDALQVPVRERNDLFEGAGISAPYENSSIEDPNFGPFRFAIDAMLNKHMPFPAFVLDRNWNIVLANAGATAMIDPGEPNMVRMMFGGSLQPMIDNWDAVAWNGLARLRQDASNHPDSEELAELIEHARSSVAGTPRPTSVGSSLVACPQFRINGTIIPTITITAQFTAARTAMTDELRIQLVFPETEAGAELFTQLAESR
ncbi:MAG: helix-turn-helix domain-containing protein [Acidimicrobiia bacterium]